MDELDVAGLKQRLDDVDYLADLGLSTALFCAVALRQPLLLEGEAGVGKTEAAKALALALDTPLVRLQCYEGITSAEALYEWNYPRQLLAIRSAEAADRTIATDDLFSADYLVGRPLLRAIQHPGPRPVVLLIDEIDRADDEFEAFLFELLAESTVTIPELGTVTAVHPPIVLLTSNRTRDLHDALKRRCLYHWIDYPPLRTAVDIIRRRVPAARDDARRAGRRFRRPPAHARPAEGARHRRGDRLGRRPRGPRHRAAHARRRRPDDRLGAEVPRGSRRRPPAGHGVGGGWLTPRLIVDLAEVAGRFGDLLHAAGVPVSPGTSGRFAAALAAVRPGRVDELYWCARVTMLSEQAQIETFDRVFDQVFRGAVDVPGVTRNPDVPPIRRRPSPAAPRPTTAIGVFRAVGVPAAGPPRSTPSDDDDVPSTAAASAEERLRTTPFDACTPAELEQLRALMDDLALDPPQRRSRRHRRAAPR